MSVNGRFNNTDCLPVIGKDGKTQWIFKLEDLKEIVPEDVWEAIEAFNRVETEDLLDDLEEAENKRIELREDGYLSLLQSTREELEAVIREAEDGITKKEILIKLKRIRQNINNNL